MKRLNRKSLLFIGIGVILGVTAITVLPRLENAVNAKQGPTLIGTYALATAAGSPTEGTIGRMVALPDGTISGGVFVLNVPRSVLIPGATGRTAVPATISGGNYTIQENGIGTAETNLMIPGQTLVRSFSLLVSQADGGIVTEAYLSQNEPTLGGGLGFFVVKRVHD